MQILHAKLYTMENAGVIEGWLTVRNGKIEALGAGEPPVREPDAFDAAGLCLVPGFIDAHTHLGVCEDGLDFEGDDANEDSDPDLPELRALDGMNPFDRCFSEAREAGVTAAAVAPGSANPIGGQICVVHTAGKLADRMTLLSPAAVKFALGENPKITYRSRNTAPVTRMATASIIRQTLAEAARYRRDLDRAAEDEDLDEPDYDFKKESLLPLLRGEISAHFHAHRADDIGTALRLSSEFGLKCVLVHCTEGSLIADELAQAGVPAIVGPNLCDRSKPELRALSWDNPRALAEAGVELALTTDHPVVPIQYLPLCAALAVKNGLDRTTALRAITIVPAKLLGLDAQIGSLAPGKRADFSLFDGDPLTLDAVARAVFIDGVQVGGRPLKI